MSETQGRTLPWDWYPGTIPDNVQVAPTAYIETTFSFYLLRSERPDAVTYGEGASSYLGTMFDIGPRGRVTLGNYTLVNGARIICESAVTIDDYALVSWNVLIMDCYRVPTDPDQRRALVRRVPALQPRRFDDDGQARPIHVGRGAWLGFNSSLLPGVTVGEGAVVGAHSVVGADVEPFTIVAGNPARLVRRLTAEEMAHGR